MLDATRTNVKVILSEDCELNSPDVLHAGIPMFPGGPGNERSYRWISRRYYVEISEMAMKK